MSAAARACREQIASALTYELPRKVVLLREAWTVGKDLLPDVEQVVSGEVPDQSLTSVASVWVIVITPRTLRRKRMGFTATGHTVHMVRYACSVFLWLKSDQWEHAVEGRDNLVDAIERCLLEWQNLTPGQRGDSGFRVVEETVRAELGSPARMSVQGGRLWTGARIGFEVDAEQTTAEGSTREPVGTVQEVVPTTEVVGPAQPFADEQQTGP